jgi:hypothetical protein
MKTVTSDGVSDLNFSTNEEADLFFENVKSMLKTQNLTITFIKKDGTERVMRCTLDPAKLPKVPVTENTETKTRKVNDEIISAFDIEAQGWRSFTKTAVQCIDFTNK